MYTKAVITVEFKDQMLSWILMTHVSCNGSLVNASAIMNAFPSIKLIRCPHENTGQVKKISKSSPLDESHWLVLPLTLGFLALLP